MFLHILNRVKCLQLIPDFLISSLVHVMGLRLKGILVVYSCLLIGLALVLSFHHRALLYPLINESNFDSLSNFHADILELATTLSEATTFDSTPSNATTISTENTEDAAIHSVADLYERLICVTAFSDNHFHEAKDMIAGLQTCLPDKKIIVYDLGLNFRHRKEVSSYCNVELRSFPFIDYQHQSHVKNLYTFAWKPIIAILMSLEYEVIMYGDTSVRMKSCNITSALAYLFEFPFLDIHPNGFHAIEFTHDGMIKYLHYPRDRKDISAIGTLQGGCWLMWANTAMQQRLIDPWLDCALHEECIAPKGAKLWPCNFTKNHDGHYVGCHRYDQSALNLILAREFGLDGILKGANKVITNSIWSIKRYPTHLYNISVCT